MLLPQDKKRHVHRKLETSKESGKNIWSDLLAAYFCFVVDMNVSVLCFFSSLFLLCNGKMAQNTPEDKTKIRIRK